MIGTLTQFSYCEIIFRAIINYFSHLCQRSNSRKSITTRKFYLFKKNAGKHYHCILFARNGLYMKKLMQIIIFLSWISSLVWAGLELEKIEFFHSLYAMLSLS